MDKQRWYRQAHVYIKTEEKFDKTPVDTFEEWRNRGGGGG